MRPLCLLAATMFGAVLAVHAPAAFAQDTIERAIDCKASRAEFSVQHVFVEHVTGKVHIQSGAITLRPGSAIPVTATATLDADSIDTGESDRDGSLESPDFFDAHKFPTWTFTSTKIIPRSDAAFEMDGTLTMHGVSQPEQLDVTMRRDNGRLAYHAVTHIDRHAFGMPITRLDPAIGLTVDVVLDLFVKDAPP